MAVALDMQSADFEQRFASLVAAKRESSADVDLTVADIIDDVRHRGDAALAELSLRFERIEIGRIGLKIGAAEIENAIGACEKTALEALKLAHARVMDFHLRQKPADLLFTDPLGVTLGWRWRPIDAVGLYVPGGAASYPSSVIMNAVPAKVAGCRRLAMVMPTPDGHINPLALAAARIAGVDEIYRVGGAQAIAALAYGTDTIAPGRQDRRPRQRLCRGGQAPGVRGRRHRHDRRPQRSRRPRRPQRRSALCRRRSSWLRPSTTRPRSRSSSPTTQASRGRWKRRWTASLPACRAPRSPARAGATTAQSSSARRSRQRFPLSIGWRRSISRSWRMTLRRSATKSPTPARSSSAPHTPEAIGDYVGGSNHVLPTARSARFSSGLGVLDFMKRTSLLKCDAGSLHALGPAAIALGEAEGLEGHARSVAFRLGANRP